MAEDEQRWCDLSQEVTPFPEPGPAVLRTSSGPCPGGSLVPVQSSQNPPEAAGPLQQEEPMASLPLGGDRGATSSPAAGPVGREEVSGDGAAAGLQSCPMCLLEFPTR